MQLPLLCEKSGTILPVLVSLTPGRLGGQQSHEILVDLESFKFSTDCIIRMFMVFNEGTLLL